MSVRFLNGGDKVKVTIMLRGREQSRPIGGVEMLQRLAADVEEYGTIESAPEQPGGPQHHHDAGPEGQEGAHAVRAAPAAGAESRAERQARPGRTPGRQAGAPRPRPPPRPQAAVNGQSKTSAKNNTTKEGSNAEDENYFRRVQARPRRPARAS